MNEDFLPGYKKKSFNCPNCGAFAHMEWKDLLSHEFKIYYDISTCSCCDQHSLWVANPELGQRMLLPDGGNRPMPVVDMPDDVKIDYLEAASIYMKSPRGAAALLRLALQKLCIHLGEDGKNINDYIRSLFKKNILPRQVIQVADTVRITGNNAVHPGEMSEEDFDYVSSKMFDLINFIVDRSITEPKRLRNLYDRTPENPRKAAEQADNIVS